MKALHPLNTNVLNDIYQQPTHSNIILCKLVYMFLLVFLCQEAFNQKLCLLTQAKYSLFCPEFMDYRKPDTGWDELKISIFFKC